MAQAHAEAAFETVLVDGLMGRLNGARCPIDVEEGGTVVVLRFELAQPGRFQFAKLNWSFGVLHEAGPPRPLRRPTLPRGG